ncbi:MAG: choice-of-anchor J domain-containing protein [Bacteroidales bacterium]|nr:choice-of-anchor J domain-containing protein [Bacteroidales bacterium]
MKAITIHSAFLIGLSLLFLSINACKEDEFDVPQASTQAKFDYEVRVIVIDEELGIENYEVKLFNRSVLAKSLLWDFGNGATSTEENPVVIYTNAGRYTITLTVMPHNEGLHYSNLVKIESFAFGKQVLLYEDFSSGRDYLDEAEWAPEGWQAIDNDDDGFNWYASYRLSAGDTIFSLRSQSYDGSTGALTPDNWLVTPEINLTSYDEADVTFRFTVGVTANTLVYRKEHYGVFIAIGNDNIESFTLLSEETFTEETPRMVPLEREVDISEYAGQIVFLAIRHYNVTDMDRIFVEEVELFVIE